MGSTIRFCDTCKGRKKIKTMKSGKVVVIRCRDCKGTGYTKT